MKNHPTLNELLQPYKNPIYVVVSPEGTENYKVMYNGEVYFLTEKIAACFANSPMVQELHEVLTALVTDGALDREKLQNAYNTFNGFVEKFGEKEQNNIVCVDTNNGAAKEQVLAGS
jgi:hypothetical protein